MNKLLLALVITFTLGSVSIQAADPLLTPSTTTKIGNTTMGTFNAYIIIV